jgi:hypothetical protein
MAEINPYTIHIPDSKLKRLQQKPELTDFPTYELEDAGWKYGTPLYSFPSSFHPPKLTTRALRSSIKTLHQY